MSRFKPNDLVQLKYQEPYGYMKVVEDLPKGIDGHKFPVVKVMLSQDLKFDFAYIKYFRPGQLEIRKNLKYNSFLY